jgi:hypothetical protein
MTTCPHDDVDIRFDEASNEPVHIICEQCHGIWPVTKAKPVQVALELLRPEPLERPGYEEDGYITIDLLANMYRCVRELAAERDRLRAVVGACREAFSLIAEEDDLADDGLAFGFHAYRHRQEQARYMLGQLDVSGNTGDE